MRWFSLLVLLWSGLAGADRGALSVDVGAGGVATEVPALHVATPKSTLSFDASFWLGGRYALSNGFEVSVTGFFEPPATVFQNDIEVVGDFGVFPGSTRHHFTRFGAQAGVRLVLGMRIRLHVGLEAGWCQGVYSKLQHFNVSSPEGAVDYGLVLPDVVRGAFVLSPLVGVEWTSADSWSLSLLPRAQFFTAEHGIGWAVIAPVQFSWSWYL